MRVGLIDLDSHNFPNLCLMKLSEYHTRRGDRVEWWDPVKQYDLVYKSRVFTDTYSKDTIQVNNADMQGLCPSLQAEFPGGGVVLSALSFPPFQKVRELGFKTGKETGCGGFSV